MNPPEQAARKLKTEEWFERLTAMTQDLDGNKWDFSPNDILALTRAHQELIALESQLSQARSELSQVDEALARRPALFGIDDRYSKIYRACEIAGRAAKAELALSQAQAELAQKMQVIPPGTTVFAPDGIHQVTLMFPTENDAIVFFEAIRALGGCS